MSRPASPRPSSAIILLAVSLILLGGCDFSEKNETTTPTADTEPPSASNSLTESEPTSQDDEPEAEKEMESETNDSEDDESPKSSNDAQASAASTQPRISADAFRMAAYEGDLSKVKSGLDLGIDVNGFDPTQKLTALHMAAYNGHTQTVAYLLSKGATVDCRDGEKKTPLIHACTGPFSETVKLLIDSGADVNAVDGTEGFTPLMMAAGLGQPEIVEILLANQAVVSQKDEDQETAIDHARNAGHEVIVKRLEQALENKVAPQK
ncbi:MAG: ankyrin repeat domain-containing protein [Rubripirellula sp.]|nr:ankyrin repeat domain-containing protein [Rubripirellula sp.]